MSQKISVLLPSRGRTTALKTSIETLLQQANKPERVEILLGMDDDDVDSIKYVEQELLPNFPNLRLLVMKQMGYGKLTVYYNTLAGMSWGFWLMVWNDDAKMNTPGWDTEIDKYEQHPMPLLRMTVEDFDHPFALFPIVKKSWFDVLGCLAPYKDLDRFAYNVAQNTAAGILVQLPVSVIHDRADITGNNNDETYQKSKQYYTMHSPDSPFSDDYTLARVVLVQNINKLRYYLNETCGFQMPMVDADTTNWKNIPAGASHKQ